MLTFSVSTEEFKTLCELVGREQYRRSTQPRRDLELERLVRALKRIADNTMQVEARRELV